MQCNGQQIVSSCSQHLILHGAGPSTNEQASVLQREGHDPSMASHQKTLTIANKVNWWYGISTVGALPHPSALRGYGDTDCKSFVKKKGWPENLTARQDWKHKQVQRKVKIILNMTS